MTKFLEKYRGIILLSIVFIGMLFYYKNEIQKYNEIYNNTNIVEKR